MFNGLFNKFSSTIDSIKSSLLKKEPIDEENKEQKDINIIEFKTENKITIIIGSTNFFFNFNDNIETIPVLLLLRGDNILYGNKVIEKISDHKYIDNVMIFNDFLYYLDKKYEESKDILIERNLMNNDFSFLKDNKDNDKTISFNYMYLSSRKEEEKKVINQEEEKKDNNKEEKQKDNNQEEEKKDNNKEEKEKIIKHKVENKGNKILPSVEQPKLNSYQNNKNLNFYHYTSEELLNIFIENLIKDKLNNLKDEYFSLKLILPPYLNNQQKEKIKSIFLNKLGEEKTNNLLNFIIKDEMDYYLENLNKKFKNKIIFIHFGGSSLVVILCDCNTGKIIKRKEKLIGGIDIDIKLTKDSLTKFKNDSNGIKIMDITLIYKVKNLIEEEKKKLYSNNKDKIEIKIDRFKYSFSLKYKKSKVDLENLIKCNETIINDFKKILENVLEKGNKDEIKNVIYTGNNFKFKIFEEILFEYFPKNICESIFDEELTF